MFLMFYFMVASIVGLYSAPVFKHLQPRLSRTSKKLLSLYSPVLRVAVNFIRQWPTHRSSSAKVNQCLPKYFSYVTARVISALASFNVGQCRSLSRLMLGKVNAKVSHHSGSGGQQLRPVLSGDSCWLT